VGFLGASGCGHFHECGPVYGAELCVLREPPKRSDVAGVFTPASSTFVDFDSVAELERVFGILSEGCQVLMPLDNYGFSQRFGWLNDRFGVSWQLNLAA
jgi:predicted 3-demethylubiquinone-9 3-methyltransferase (glyoxalase superfamily)